MKKILPIIIIIIAAFFRFYKLTSVPACMNWDEAAFGYNAFSILRTGNDEFGNHLPLLFKSFGDYKFPFFVYLLVPFVKLFGLELFTVRFVQSLFGTISVYVFYKLVKLISKKENVSLIAALFLAISPWHLQIVRGGTDVAISITLTLTAIYFLFAAFKKNPKYLLISAMIFALSIYTYFIERVFIPVFLITFSFYYRKTLWEQRQKVLNSFLLGLIFLVPVFFQLFSSGHEEKFLKTTVFGIGINHEYYDSLTQDGDSKTELRIFHNRSLDNILDISNHYLSQFSPSFLFTKGAFMDNRQRVYGMGVMYFFDLILLIPGIYSCIKSKNKDIKFLFLWLLVAPAPSVITRDPVHARRTVYMLFPILILSSFGLIKLYSFIQSTLKNLYRYFIYLLFFAVVLWSIGFYILSYYIYTPLLTFKGTAGWSCGYKEVVEKTQKYKDRFPNIIVDNLYQGPYIFYLFYEKYPPEKYQNEVIYQQDSKDVLGEGTAYQNYQFRSIYWPKDRLLKKTLFIGAPERLPLKDIKPDEARILDTVFFPNGDIAFYIVETF